ncbi:MAG: 2-amino-4-hydroxy-6-hydroxymethyldihydropteridine diphosphokinase [Porticoccaceae bacterium]
MSSQNPGQHRVIISVGSNIDPERHIAAAREILATDARLLVAADIIETTPVGYPHQPDFLNTAYLIETDLNPADFKVYLKSVEDRLGRVRGPIKSGPRTIDLDMIAWDGQLLTDDYLHFDYVSIPVDQVALEGGISLHFAD